MNIKKKKYKDYREYEFLKKFQKYERYQLSFKIVEIFSNNKYAIELFLKNEICIKINQTEKGKYEVQIFVNDKNITDKYFQEIDGLKTLLEFKEVILESTKIYNINDSQLDQLLIAVGNNKKN